MEDDYYTVAKVTDLAPGQFKCFRLKKRSLILYNLNGEFFCSQSKCLHQGADLSVGFLEGDKIVCPLHMWKYSIKTGRCSFDGTTKLKTFPVRINGSQVQVDIKE
jgi:nitrite reductase/ring-hydroxylating ferredoxin subunit